MQLSADRRATTRPESSSTRRCSHPKRHLQLRSSRHLPGRHAEKAGRAGAPGGSESALNTRSASVTAWIILLKIVTGKAASFHAAHLRCRAVRMSQKSPPVPPAPHRLALVDLEWRRFSGPPDDRATHQARRRDKRRAAWFPTRRRLPATSAASQSERRAIRGPHRRKTHSFEARRRRRLTPENARVGLAAHCWRGQRRDGCSGSSRRVQTRDRLDARYTR